MHILIIFFDKRGRVTHSHDMTVEADDNLTLLLEALRIPGDVRVTTDLALHY